MKNFILGTVLCTLMVAGAHVQAQGSYTVQPGDVLNVSVWKEPELEREVLVTPDGAFAFPLVGAVDARGKTITELQGAISYALSRFIADPVVTVTVEEINGNKVFVLGQVNKPGEFIVNPRVDVMQALSMAGGTTPFASLDGIRILRRSNGQLQALSFNYSDVAKGRNLSQNILLESGDLVLVP